MAKKEVEVPADVPAVGQEAPDFELTADDGTVSAVERAAR